MSDMMKFGISIVVTIDGYGKQTCASFKEAYAELGIDKPDELFWVDERKTRYVELVGIGRIDVTYR